MYAFQSSSKQRPHMGKAAQLNTVRWKENTQIGFIISALSVKCLDKCCLCPQTFKAQLSIWAFSLDTSDFLPARIRTLSIDGKVLLLKHLHSQTLKRKWLCARKHVPVSLGIQHLMSYGSGTSTTFSHWRGNPKKDRKCQFDFSFVNGVTHTEGRIATPRNQSFLWDAHLGSFWTKPPHKC